MDMKENTQLDKIKTRIMKHFESPYSFQGIHGSGECCFENIAFSIGFYDENISDDIITEFYEFYLNKLASSDELNKNDFIKTMVLNGLLYSGKRLGRNDKAVTDAFLERLSRVYNFAVSGEKIFYNEEERKNIKGVPKCWRDAPVVRYEHVNPNLRLPIIYDLLGFSVMYGKNKESDRMIDGIIKYVLSAYYQEEVKSGYGIGINGESGFVKSPYYAVGWDLCFLHITRRQTLLYSSLLSKIPCAVSSEWYQSNRKELLQAVETDNTAFLKEILSSIRKTYWTSGCYMDFGKNKKQKIIIHNEISS